MLRAIVGVVSALALLTFGASAALAAPPAAPVAFDGDVVALAGAAKGHPIASLSGSIGSTGKGTATLAPSGYARRAGYGRGEQALIFRRSDGTFLVLGGLGTRLTVSTSGRSFTATGVVATRIRGRRTVPVRVSGLVLSQRARPARGQTLLMLGSPTGPIVDALRQRYQLVQYDPARHSRAALLADPDLYANVAGIVVDGSLRASDADAVSEVRAMFNAGRWVAASPRAATLSQVMYPVFHAHFRGSQGALIRSADSGNGTSARLHFVTLEPRLHWVRTRFAQKRLQRRTPPVRVMKSMRRQSKVGLRRSLAAGERLGLKATTHRRARQGVSTNSTADGCVNSVPASASPNLATYEICVNTTVTVASTAGTLLNPWSDLGANNLCGSWLGASSWCATGSSTCNTTGGGWTTGSDWDCGAYYGTMYSSNVQPTGPNQWITLLADTYPTTLSQVSTMQFERTYVVSLANSGTGAFQQWVSEIDASNFDAIDTATNPQLTTLNTGNGFTALTPNTTTMFPTGYYCGLGSGNSCNGATTNQLVSANPWQSPYWWEPAGSGTTILEGGFSAGAFLHLTSISYQPQSGQTATPVIASSNGADGGTAPLEADVTANVAGSSSTSSSTWNTTQNQAGWYVQGNVDASCEAADCEATGEVSGSISAGYSNTTTTSSGSTSSVKTSATSNQTLANWTTQAFIASTTGADAAECATPVSGGAGTGATTVAGPCSAWLLDSVWYPNLGQGGNWSNYVPALVFGGEPTRGLIFAAQCSPNGTGCFNNTASTTPPSAGWGAGQNVEQLLPASTASFVLQGSASGSQSAGFVGTVTPTDEDTFYLVDQVSAGPLASTQAQVLGIMLSQLGASVSATCMGACATSASTPTLQGGVPTIASTFTMGGAPVSGGGTELTLSDLDLCAPPVMTTQLWQNGCDTDPAYTQVPPQTWAPIPLVQSSAELTAPYEAIIGKPVVCGPGTWSNATGYSYAWYQYVTSQNQNAWEAVTSGVQAGSPNTFVPPSGSTGKQFLCAVTATGPQGSTTVTSGAFTVVDA